MADPGEIRVSDDERRAVDAVLQRAHGEGRLTLVEYEERAASAWAARTRGELDVLTSDLPAVVPEGRQPVAADRGAGSPSRTRRGGRRLGTLAVAAALLRAGGPFVTADDGPPVFGDRTIAVVPGDDRVELGFLFGGTDVVVPDDARVVVDGTVIFGGVDCDAACDGTGTREITVDASGAFGGVDVLTQSEAAVQDRDDDD
ncbi:MAG: DUF1707 domain-containing protein [Pseudonocardia sp.]|nr:DUF1707 domain-containing protein [Pseudonocardia sp.]